ncbi:glycoside hydrolase family 19 protein [Sphingobacterium spiritivorum]|uniref:glycoside hydrolase family 19 protein n=1 Tax=Sphingobacterium spiritivorum TaxID=258 RepID=UPI00191957FD|nr:glycoside hydrolase family 19 protein [Sphingobacterium spiritivorum]QQT26812.1 glycoside hydrolase family 19 protein [Sphingobacterium spiritivorum]
MNKIESIKYIQNFVCANPDGILGNETLTKFQCRFNVPTKAMVAHFFGNMIHESGDFTIVSENMYYTKVATLRKTWPSRFTSDELAKQFLRSPEKLGNFVYDGRMGNAKGEGYKYRGRGWMQLTGKDMYELFSKYIGEDCVNNPDLVATKYPLESAVFMFTQKRLWGLVSTVSEEDIKVIRRRVNGGLIGIDKVIPLVQKIFNMMR